METTLNPFTLLLKLSKVQPSVGSTKVIQGTQAGNMAFSLPVSLTDMIEFDKD